MLTTVLRLSGLARTLGSFKVRLEDKADHALEQVKSTAMRIAIAAALALASLVFAMLALVIGLIALYAYLYPVYGELPALGIVGGTVVVVAVLLAVAAALIGRSKAKRKSPARPVDEPEDDSRWQPARGNGHRVPRRYALSPREARAAADVAESVVSMTTGKSGRRVRHEDYSADAITLLRTSDRATMMAVLGTVVAAGWLAGRTVPRFMGR